MLDGSQIPGPSMFQLAGYVLPTLFPIQWHTEYWHEELDDEAQGIYFLLIA